MAKRKLPAALKANKFKKGSGRAKATGNTKSKGGRGAMPAAVKKKLAGY